MDLSVIILSYNTKDITDECLRRLQVAVDRVQGNEIEVIVLDNASTDGSVEMIKKNHPWVKLIESKENTGFSKGNNIALKESSGKLVLFLNSDCFVKADTLEKSLKFMGEQECDVLGIKLTYEDGKLQYSAGNLPTPLNTIFWILGLGQLINPFHPTDEAFFKKERKVGWIMGAYFMIKREVFESVGMFDEDIFMYMDEVDLCKRIESSGYKACFTPEIEAVHLHGASSKQFPEQIFTNELKGIKVYFNKYYPLSYLYVKPFLILGLILRVFAFSILGKLGRAKAYVDGLGVI